MAAVNPPVTVARRGRYLDLPDGELASRARAALGMLEDCHVCPHACAVNRRAGELGVCKTGFDVALGAAVPHFGEEPVLVGRHGVGNVFVSSCNLHCRYCQNFEISHDRQGTPASFERLALAMLALQEAGCDFIGWVSPSHVVPQLLAGLSLAVERGFDRPIIYNTSSWDSLESLRLLDGVVSVYLPDLKYACDEVARRLSGCVGYVGRSRAALEEMYRQVGNLCVGDDGLALSGLLVRHLVLPNDLAGSWESLSYLRIEFGRDIGLPIMSQYAPTVRVADHPELGRPATREEYERVLGMVAELGFRHVFAQDFEAQEVGMPSFSERVPFTWPDVAHPVVSVA
jgi:putative pyruvate formate lyase activating enzyme